MHLYNKKGKELIMTRKTKISKEIILEAALEMLIQDGFDAINIKTLSAKIGCSTQPLVWHFDNMEGLRKALSEYALEYANEKMRPNCENVLEAFEYVGKQYLCIALNESKLFRFLYLEGYCGETANHFDALAEDQENQELVNGISKQLEISKECASRYVRNAIIFTQKSFFRNKRLFL